MWGKVMEFDCCERGFGTCDGTQPRERRRVELRSALEQRFLCPLKHGCAGKWSNSPRSYRSLH